MAHLCANDNEMSDGCLIISDKKNYYHFLYLWHVLLHYYFLLLHLYITYYWCWGKMLGTETLLRKTFGSC